MPNTNDALAAELEVAFPDYDAEVEGVGYGLSPFKITLKGKKDGHKHVVYTSLSKKEVFDKFKGAVAH